MDILEMRHAAHDISDNIFKTLNAGLRTSADIHYIRQRIAVYMNKHHPDVKLTPFEANQLEELTVRGCVEKSTNNYVEQPKKGT
jgi:hypothetical protein